MRSPTLLFQAAIEVDVRELMSGIAPILLLAIVAVCIVTGLIGLAIAILGIRLLVDGLLLGAIVATTNPSAVIAVFLAHGGPSRLVRLVEGEVC